MNNLLCLSLAFLSFTQLLPHALGAGGARKAAAVITSNNPQIPATGPPADIVASCAMARDKDFCVKTLTGNPQSKGMDLNQLALLALQMAQVKGKAVFAAIEQRLLKQQSMSAALSAALNDCSDQYTEALGHVSDAVTAILANEIPYNDIRSELSAAGMTADVCRREIQVADGNKPGDDIGNTEFAKLCENAVSIVTVMQSIALQTGQARTLS